jgi:hypothetical protein
MRLQEDLRSQCFQEGATSKTKKESNSRSCTEGRFRASNRTSVSTKGKNSKQFQVLAPIKAEILFSIKVSTP